MVNKKESNEQKERKEAFQALPKTIKEKLTDEEIKIFLYNDVWPETLFKKLSDFIYPMER